MEVLEQIKNLKSKINGCYDVNVCEDYEHDIVEAVRPLIVSNPVAQGKIRIDKAPSFPEKAATNANFGHGSETKYDPSIRQALEIPFKELNQDEWIPLLPKIAWKIRDNMFPYQTISIIPYKLQIYNESGHFKPHTDTLHHPNHVATLLLRLPNRHDGGTLEIKNGEDTILWKQDDDHYIDYGKKADGPNPHYIDWICFFTDMPHEVKPVTKGQRVIFQLEVYCTEEKIPQAWYRCEKEDLETNETIQEKFEEDEEIDTKIPFGDSKLFQKQRESILLRVKSALDNFEETPGFFLEHFYPTSALLKAEFKGVDFQLKNLFNTLGYSVCGVPASLDASWEYDGDTSFTLLAWDVKGLPQEVGNPRNWFIFSIPELGIYSHTIKHKSAIAYTGNESEDGSLKAITGFMLLYHKSEEPPKKKRCVDHKIIK